MSVPEQGRVALQQGDALPTPVLQGPRETLNGPWSAGFRSFPLYTFSWVTWSMATRGHLSSFLVGVSGMPGWPPSPTGCGFMEQCGAHPLPLGSHTDVPGLPRARSAAVVEGPPETRPGHRVKVRAKVLEKALPLGVHREGVSTVASPQHGASSLLSPRVLSPPTRAAQDFTEFPRNRSRPQGEGKAWFPGGTCRTWRGLPGPPEGTPLCPTLRALLCDAAALGVSSQGPRSCACVR